MADVLRMSALLWGTDVAVRTRWVPSAGSSAYAPPSVYTARACGAALYVQRIAAMHTCCLVLLRGEVGIW